ncbi:Heavy-metal resistance [Desulfatibacillum alkenivorans DSM 16219]|jgi:exonuclease VII small subunit|uniref:Heavy-metal resistance n=1 Tax=Desulfatibacillum alkenivorans DSM 16219 TaxID=1121393 RepID=A0A1M6TQH2_9BACT|nr:periplasmic heavy metal sensor [Desulfatibacillum alkenivorans]SHK59221.1 Heavy-metal resistance [Desulfatibacillum alkenivorans DSM 16219]
MNLLQKRILIIFSIALNIGFVVVALILVFQHSGSHHKATFEELAGIVHQLDLPEEQEQSALKCVKDFNVVIHQLHDELADARKNISLVLSADGPLAPEKLHAAIAAADKIQEEKSIKFEAHALELRSILGDEKGAEFFQLMHARLKKTRDKND